MSREEKFYILKICQIVNKSLKINLIRTTIALFCRNVISVCWKNAKNNGYVNWNISKMIILHVWNSHIIIFSFISWVIMSYTCTLDILFLSNHNIHKSSCGLWFLSLRPFNWKILVKSINWRIWIPKTKAIRIVMNVVNWRKKYI